MGKPAEPRTPLLHPSRRAALRRRLSAWYALARRDLPWRATRDPYAVWVSEVMLQQTTVAAATPYWSRFLERFPDVASLAAAPEEDVLRAWSGLGYYRRAKNMHAAAREIVERHGGRMPRGSRALRELPGIGAYTSAAIASICHGEPAAVVDGNVLRVLARLELVEGNVARRRARGLIERLADELLDPAQPGDHNQAVMELGATVCRPREPDCPVCPWRSLCRARREGAVETVPRMPERAAPIRVLDAIAIVRGPRGTVLLKRVPEGRRNAGLLELPRAELESGRAARGAPAALAPGLARRVSAAFRHEHSLAIVPVAWRGRVRHSITRHVIDAVVIDAEASPRPRAGGPWSWVSAGSLTAEAVTGLTRKVAPLLTSP